MKGSSTARGVKIILIERLATILQSLKRGI
jgi:hypothetical protein